MLWQCTLEIQTGLSENNRTNTSVSLKNSACFFARLMVCLVGLGLSLTLTLISSQVMADEG